MAKKEKILKFLWNELIYGGHLISFGAVSIVFTSAILLDIKITWDFLIIVYLFSYSSLLYNRYKEQKNDYLTNPERTTNFKKYFQHIFSIILFSVLTSIVILIYYNKTIALIFLIFLFFLGFLYTQYFKRITRKIIAFKNIYFSFVTSSLLILLAFYYSYSLLVLSLFLILIFVFLRMFINTVFLDIKDIKGDKKEELLTLPIIFKEKRTLIFLGLINIFSVLPIIIGSFYKLIPKFSLILLLIIPYTFFYLGKSIKKTNFYIVNYILADFEFILWSILVIIGKTLL